MLEQQHIDNFVTEVLSAHDLARYRDLFLFNRDYNKESMSTTCEELIRPHSLTRDEIKIESGLLGIALSNPKIKIQPLNREKLTEVLVLKPPKKGIEISPLVPDEKSTMKSSKSKRIMKPKTQTAPIGLTDEQEMKRRKRMRSENYQDFADENIAHKEGMTSDDMRGRHRKLTTPSKTTATTKSPSNLLNVLTTVFNEFWDMQLNPVIAAPFFSLITPENCAAFGMADYFSKVEIACTLTNIKERLESGKYQFVETFIYDFSLMFNNCFAYFDSKSPQFLKALELKEKFERDWEAAKLLLK